MPAASPIVAGALLWPPNLHDLVLGNVMALYVGALSVVVARRGWLGAAPLGIVLALAAKPAILPFAHLAPARSSPRARLPWRQSRAQWPSACARSWPSGSGRVGSSSTSRRCHG